MKYTISAKDYYHEWSYITNELKDCDTLSDSCVFDDETDDPEEIKEEYLNEREMAWDAMGMDEDTIARWSNDIEFNVNYLEVNE